MSERFTATSNVNGSKNTRLNVATEFGNYRFGRDALAHVSRYLLVCERMIDLAKQLGRPIKVLDVGCGDVYVARTLVSSFVVKKTDVIAQYVGLDIDDPSLARTRATAPKSMPIRLVCGDITTGALKRWGDKEFDLVVNLEMIEHIKPEFVPGFLSEVKRLSHRALISTPNFTGGTGQLPDDHIKEWDTDELASLMQSVGLKVENRIGVFCNLTKARKICEADGRLRGIWEELEGKLPSDLFSLAMARFIGTASQNVLYEVSCD